MKKNKLVMEPREAGAFISPRVAVLALLLIICFFFMAHDAPFEVAAMSQTVERNQTAEASDDILASKSDDEAHISGSASDQHISGAPGSGDQHISGVPGRSRSHEEKERHEGRGRHEGRERDEDRDEHRELTITFIEYLGFGEMTGDTISGGKAVISPQTGEMEMFGMTSLGGLYRRAELIIQGKPNKRFYVTLPGTVNLRNSNGVTSRLTDFTIYPSQTGIIDSDGFASVYVGATLTLSDRRDGNILGRSEGEVFIFVDYFED